MACYAKARARKGKAGKETRQKHGLGFMQQSREKFKLKGAYVLLCVQKGKKALYFVLVILLLTTPWKLWRAETGFALAQPSGVEAVGTGERSSSPQVNFYSEEGHASRFLDRALAMFCGAGGAVRVAGLASAQQLFGVMSSRATVAGQSSDAPLWAFNGSYADYIFRVTVTGYNGSYGETYNESIPLSFDIFDVNMQNQTFYVSVNFGGALSNASATYLASFSDPSPFPAISPEDLAALDSGTVPPDMAGTRLMTGISISVPAGTFSALEIIEMSEVEYALYVDPTSGLVIESTAGILGFSGTLELTKTNVRISSPLPPTTYDVTIEESGLPSGTTWSVTLDGTSKSSSGSTITFQEQPGTYTYSITSPSGYTPSSGSGFITVTDAPITQAITFSIVTAPYSASFTVWYGKEPFDVTLYLTQAGYNALSSSGSSDQIQITDLNELSDFLVKDIQYVQSVKVSSSGIALDQAEASRVLYATLVWAQLYSSESNMYQWYGPGSAGYEQLQVLLPGEGIQNLGINLAQQLKFASLFAPLTDTLETVLGSEGADQVSGVVKLLFECGKGYQALVSDYGTSTANAISQTLAEYGLISQSDEQDFGGQEFLAGLSMLSSSQYSSFLNALYQDLSPGEQLSNGAEQTLESTLEGLLSDAGSSLILEAEAFSVSGLTATTSFGIGMSSFSTTIYEYVLPLALANAIENMYIMPMADMYSDENEILNELSCVYPVLFSSLSSMTVDGDANATAGVLSAYLATLTNSLWGNYIGLQSKIDGDTVTASRSQVEEESNIASVISTNVQTYMFQLDSLEKAAELLASGTIPSVSQIGAPFPALTSQLYGLSVTARTYNAVEGALSRVGQTVSSGLSSIGSGITHALESVKGFWDIKIGGDPPSAIVYFDGYYVFVNGSRAYTDYPFAYAYVGGGGLQVFLDGWNGSLAIELNESAPVTVYYSNSSVSLPVFTSTLQAYSVRVMNVSTYPEPEALSGPYSLELVPVNSSLTNLSLVGRGVNLTGMELGSQGTGILGLTPGTYEVEYTNSSVPRTVNVTVGGSKINEAVLITRIGAESIPTATKVSLQVSPSIASVGSDVTVTAKALFSNGTLAPDQPLDFYANGKEFATATSGTGGFASVSYRPQTAGQYNFTAVLALDPSAVASASLSVASSSSPLPLIGFLIIVVTALVLFAYVLARRKQGGDDSSAEDLSGDSIWAASGLWRTTSRRFFMNVQLWYDKDQFHPVFLAGFFENVSITYCTKHRNVFQGTRRRIK